MAVIDYSTPEGKLRMRLGDTSDLPFLPSSVYDAVYAENNNNLFASVKALGSMILGQLAFKTHRKIGLSLEIWGAEAFENYMQFLILTVKDPAFFSLSFLPYGSVSEDVNSLTTFISDWNRSYYTGNQSQSMALGADIGPNDGSRYGPLGSVGASWEAV